MVLPFQDEKNYDSIFYPKTIYLFLLYSLNSAQIARTMRGIFLMSFL